MLNISLINNKNVIKSSEMKSNSKLRKTVNMMNTERRKTSSQNNRQKMQNDIIPY